jgi:hypothetical protein
MAHTDASLFWQATIWGFTVRELQRQDASGGIGVAVGYTRERMCVVTIRAGTRVVAAGAGGPLGIGVAGRRNVTPIAPAVVELHHLP